MITLTVGTGHNIECTASPIMANRSRAPGWLGVHEGKGTIEHPIWGFKGFFTGSGLQYGRCGYDGTAFFEDDNEEDDKAENFEGNHALKYRQMALNGLCHTSVGDNPAGPDEQLTDTLTEMDWQEDRTRTIEYMWDEKTGEWIEEDPGRWEQDRLERITSDLLAKGFVLEWELEGGDTQDGRETWVSDQHNPESINHYKGKPNPYYHDPNYKWVGGFVNMWVKTDKKQHRRKHWEHSEYVKAHCKPSSGICKCSDFKRRNRKGELYNVFPKWKWCSSHILFGFRQIDPSELKLEIHQVKFIPATLDGYYVEDEESEAEELLA